nr:12345_t:CDS:2 [Entrophospora candida]
MKINKLLVPMVALSVAYNYPNSQVEAVTPCVQGCIAVQATGAKACTMVTVYNPIVYAGCMLTENLEYVSISDPRINKVREFGWNSYVCEIYFSYTKHSYPPIYGTNPIEPLCLALEIVKNNLKGLVAADYVISEVESKEI